MTTPASIAAALRNHVEGRYCLAAAAELLIALPWLHRADFTSRFITVHRSPGPPQLRPWVPVCPAPEASSGC